MSAQSLRAMTKAQLIQVITEANDRNIKLSDELHALRTTLQATIADHKEMSEELELTQQKLKAAQAVNEKLLAQPAAQPAKQLSPARAAYLASATARREASQVATEAYRAKCAAARALAMATGKAVLV